ncbi:MAG TPA: hypothetical protein VHM90_21210, partial [Phycisphaerae bacterium]|nr:hypothetical protein [Phycisphaerae bacterium]
MSEQGIAPARPATPAARGEFSAGELRSTPRPQWLRMVRAMVAKEVREMAIWACALLVIASVAIWFAMAAQLRAGHDRPVLAVSMGMRTLFVMLPAMAAGALGMVQFYFDMRPGRRGFLLHRPVPRGVWFACKAATGVALYLASLGVPLMMAMGWASDPHRAPLPFSWEMAGSLWVDVASGLPYYFAAALAAMRWESRWWGSRLLPLGFALGNSSFNMTLPGLREPLAFSLAAAVIVAASAWAHFAAGGQFQSQWRLSKALLAIIFAASCCGLGRAGLSFLDNHAPESWTRSGTYDFGYDDTVFLKDGTPAIARTEYSSGGYHAQLRTMEGKVIGDFQPSDFYSENGPLLQRHGMMFRGNVGFSPNAHDDGHYFNWTGLNLAIPASENCLVWVKPGFDEARNASTGVLDAAGSHPFERAPRAPFPGRLIVTGPYGQDGDLMLLAAGDSLYTLDAQMRLGKFYTDPLHDEILGSSACKVDGILMPLVETQHAFTLLSGMENPKPVLHYDFEGIAHGGVAIGYLGKSQGTYRFLLTAVKADGEGRNYHSFARVLQSDGTRGPEIALPGYSVSTMPTESFMEGTLMPLLRAPLPRYLHLALELRERGTLDRDMQASWQQLRWVLAGAVAAALTAAVLSWRRWKNGGAAAGWALIGFLGGPFALAALAAVGTWKVAAPCAACGQPYPVTQTGCPRCGAARPAPPPPRT